MLLAAVAHRNDIFR
jgi:D-alanyl-D-alanine carboxypeptidase (penicillin-binding protein 5/6)